MSNPERSRYRRTNWTSCKDALRRRGSLPIWLDKDMVWLAPGAGRNGRPPVFSDAAIQFCLMVKVLFGLPLRQTTGMVASILSMAGLDWPVPDFSTLSRRQRSIEVQISSRRAPGPLNLLVDSTGIRFPGDGEWLARKHGTRRRRQYRKVHLAMAPVTGDIRAVEFTSSDKGDSPILPHLLDQIPPDEQIGTVTGDGAFDTRRCHTAILERGGTAVIPIRKNGRRWRQDCPAAAVRNEILRATQRPGRTIWRRWSGYHARSRIEARMRCLKAFGERIASRDPDRQTAEIHIRVALMNRSNALGSAEIERVA
ncbi:IS5 family transposase [Paracoccus sp. DMF-8]|uniref:IS5 family transposase n=1 Tax=Paracoccus sp. DMF-8 TaxID=3019445 RepID=UPI0023E78239|nr:IS5 family transposase [Paracoccus sp. DMF-8]MDF3605995.1 IS5 family transposase [Paracoccus sp. DMF-8]